MDQDVTPHVEPAAGAPRAGELAGYVVRYVGDEGRVFAELDGATIGVLRWDYVHADPPVVLDVDVEERFRRQGVATRLFETARAHESRLVHSDVLSDAGRAFVAAFD